MKHFLNTFFLIRIGIVVFAIILILLLLGDSRSYGATILFPYQGGSGTSTLPVDGQLLIGSGGSYKVNNLTAGSNITISNGSGTISISSSGGSASTTINGTEGPFTFATSGLFGFSISTSSQTITFKQATSSGSQAGFLSATDWTTFNGKQNTISFPLAVASTSLTGGVGLTLTTNDMACDTASASVFGCLASADWTTFNNKQSAVSWPIPIASTSLAVTTPLLLTTNQLSLPTSTASQNGFLTSANWTTFNAKITTSSLSSTATGLSYDNVTGIFSWTAGYEGLRTASSTNWNTAYDDRLKWDGGATGLVAATGRTSLGLTDTATIASSTWLKVALNGSDINSTSTFRSNLGLTDTVLFASSTWLKVLNNLSDLNNAATARTNLGVAIGTNVQAWDNDLDDFAALTPTKGDLITTAGTDWADFAVGTNGKVLTASSTATNGISWETIVASASAGGANTNIQVNEGGSIAGYSTLTYASGTQLLTVPSSTITGFLKVPNGAGGTTINSAGLVGVDSTSRTLNFHDGTAEVVLNPEKCTDLPMVIENPTSTAGHVDNNPGTILGWFNATSTITKVTAVNTKAGDTATFNLTYNSNRNSATSTFALFTSQQTVTSTSTLTVLTPNASTTPNQYDILRVNFTAASSSQMMIGWCYRQTP